MFAAVGRSAAVLVIALATAASGFSLGPAVTHCRLTSRTHTTIGMTLHRRDALCFGAVAAFTAAVRPAEADVKPCPGGANNCWSTASSGKNAMSPWKWPAGVSRADAVAALKKALDSYPQAGQGGVDLGGWAVAVDELADSGYMRVEFKSGIGNFAKFFNGGKPFVDDLEFSVGESAVAVRSSSRVGDSDLGVNAKRLNYLSEVLRSQGWDAPAIKA